MRRGGSGAQFAVDDGLQVGDFLPQALGIGREPVGAVPGAPYSSLRAFWAARPALVMPQAAECSTTAETARRTGTAPRHEEHRIFNRE